MTTELAWAALALLLVALATLRKRLRAAVVVCLVPAAIGQWSHRAPELAVESWLDLVTLPLQAGPIGVFGLAVLAFLPRYTPDRCARASRQPTRVAGPVRQRVG